MRYIRLSYRIRGRVVRIQRNKIANIRVFRAKNILVDLGRKSEDVNIHIAIILVYSAINNIAKGPALYSILNPDTSSDSPSTKS